MDKFVAFTAAMARRAMNENKFTIQMLHKAIEDAAKRGEIDFRIINRFVDMETLQQLMTDGFKISETTATLGEKVTVISW